MKNVDNKDQCTAEGYRKFHNLHTDKAKGGLRLRMCNDGNTECQLKCKDDAFSGGSGTVKCEIGKYGDYRYIGITPCQEIDCEENGNGDCAKCEGNSGKYCYTSTIFGICSSSDGNKCVEELDCEENENLGGNCANCEGNSGQYCFTSTINGGVCSSDGNKCVGESNEVRHAPRGRKTVDINGNDEGKCTKQGYRDFFRSYKKKYVGGLRLTSNCKNGSTECLLACNKSEYYMPGSSSGTINCENGIYWFDELPKACKRHPDSWFFIA